MKQFFSDLLEVLAAIILVPLVLLYKLIAFILILALIASPLILIGYVVWMIAS